MTEVIQENESAGAVPVVQDSHQLVVVPTTDAEQAKTNNEESEEDNGNEAINAKAVPADSDSAELDAAPDSEA